MIFAIFHYFNVTKALQRNSVNCNYELTCGQIITVAADETYQSISALNSGLVNRQLMFTEHVSE